MGRYKTDPVFRWLRRQELQIVNLLGQQVDNRRVLILIHLQPINPRRQILLISDSVP